MRTSGRTVLEPNRKCLHGSPSKGEKRTYDKRGAKQDGKESDRESLEEKNALEELKNRLDGNIRVLAKNECGRVETGVWGEGLIAGYSPRVTEDL